MFSSVDLTVGVHGGDYQNVKLVLWTVGKVAIMNIKLAQNNRIKYRGARASFTLECLHLKTRLHNHMYVHTRTERELISWLVS